MIFDLIIWLLAIELLALVAWPLTCRAFAGAPDMGLSAAKPCGVLLFGCCAWLANWFFRLPLTFPYLLLLLGGMVVAASIWLRSWRGLEELRDFLPTIIKVQILYIAAFLFFLFFRSMQPEIFWGEKPMDFTFLNYLIRTEDLPPQEPWAAGHELKYYYLGSFMFALLHKLAGVDSAIGYNLSVVTVGALIVCSIFTLLLRFRVPVAAALTGAICIAGLSNWEVLRLYFSGEQRLGFDLFWASSRVFTSPSFSEYPFWSVLFADLHAHFIAMPFAILGFAAAVSAAAFVREERNTFLPFLHGLIVGALFCVNSWDCISQALVAGVFLAGGIVIRSSLSWSKRLSRGLEYGVLLSLTAALLIIPFRFSIGSGPQIHWGWVMGEFNTVNQIIRYFGLWLVPLTVLLSLFVLRSCRAGIERYSEILPASLIAVLPIVLGFMLSEHVAKGMVPWGIIFSSSFFLYIAAHVSTTRVISESERSAALLALAAGVIIILSEVLFLMDRMNTIFKFYIPVWTLAGAALFGMLPAVARSLGVFGSRAVALVTILACIGGGLATGINGVGMISFHRIPVATRPTLDGMAYLANTEPDSKYLFDWMRRNIKGQPIVLEAFGNSYGPYTRVSMNTGLPTVLGWEHHVGQRGVPGAEVERRKREIREFYSTQDFRRGLEILRRYGVTYVVLGQVERENYSRGVYQREGLSKFSRHPEIFKRVFESGAEELYLVSK